MIRKFIDLQINGYKGTDFSSGSLTDGNCAQAFKGIIEAGTVMFLPTLITSPLDILERNLRIISEVMASDEFRNHVPGIHIEGPFFTDSPAIGAHNPAYTQKADTGVLKRLLKASNHTIKMMTVGADLPSVENLVRYAVGENIRVSLGHHMADAGQIGKAVKAGATALTHLGNGVPNLVHRHNNPIWAGLAYDELKAMIITDGHHLPAELIRIFFRIKGADNILVVSDAAPLAGMPPGKYNTLGNDVILQEDGKLYNPDKNCLVGSSAMMAGCIRYLCGTCGFDPKTAEKTGFNNQLEYLGLPMPGKHEQ